jgi:hypothetical protein
MKASDYLAILIALIVLGAAIGLRVFYDNRLYEESENMAVELAYQRQLLQKHTRQLEELDSLIHLYPFPPSEKLVKGIRINTGFSKRLHKMEETE